MTFSAVVFIDSARWAQPFSHCRKAIEINLLWWFAGSARGLHYLSRIQYQRREATQGFREVDTQTLLRAKPSKDGDAELRGYREPMRLAMLAGPPAHQNWRFFFDPNCSGSATQ